MKKKEMIKELITVEENKILNILSKGTDRQKTALCEHYYLSYFILNKYGHHLTPKLWERVIVNQELNEEIVIKYKGDISWKMLSSFHQLNEPFAQRFIDKFDAFTLFKYNQFSESFLIRNFNVWKVSGNYSVCRFQTLSERFIEDYKQHLNWQLISEYQNMGVRFIVKYSDLIHEDKLRLNKKINQREMDRNNVWVMFKLLSAN